MQQEYGQDSAMRKLGMDLQRYYRDHDIHGVFGFLKLMIVVDFWPIFYYRLLEYCCEKRSFRRRSLQFFLTPLKPFIEGLSGARIYHDAVIGGGLLLHQSSGVVIAPKAVLGKNCTLFSGACVVYKANNKGFEAPIIGDNVKLMIGSKVIGAVKIGNNVVVGANAVVTKDIPSGGIVVGIPGRIVNLSEIKV